MTFGIWQQVKSSLLGDGHWLALRLNTVLCPSWRLCFLTASSGQLKTKAFVWQLMCQPSRFEILTSSAWRHGGEKVWIRQLICHLVKRYRFSLLGPVIPVRLFSAQPKAWAGLKTSGLLRCSLTNRRWLLRQSETLIQGKLLYDKEPV